MKKEEINSSNYPVLVRGFGGTSTARVAMVADGSSTLYDLEGRAFVQSHNHSS